MNITMKWSGLSRAVCTGLLAAALAGCAATRNDTAWQVIQEQKQEQALVRQYEAEQSRRQAPSEPRLMQSLISESLDQGRHFAALAYIDAYVQRFGNDRAVQAMRARALRLTGQHDESAAAYRSLLQGDQAAEAWHGLGLLAGAQGDFTQAAQDLSKAAALAPTDADILNDLGYARMRAGDTAGARIPLGQAAELAPGNTRTLANLAVLLLVDGQPDQAQRLMEKAALLPEVRSQIYQLAQSVRIGPTPASAPAAASYNGSPVAAPFNHSRMIH